MKPYLKWPGGKARQQERVRALFGERAKLYVEPFLGAGAVFFARAEADEFESAIISDVNPRLMACHMGVAVDVESVIGWLDLFPKTRDPDEYATLRDMFNAVQPVDHAREPGVYSALFIWLNHACFNGLYRENLRGEFNVPVGKGPLSLPSPDHLRACSQALRKAEIRTAPFLDLDIFLATMFGTQIYADPPYVPVSPTSAFTSYSAGGFNVSQQTLLRDFLAQASMRGAQVVTSNSDTPYTRDLYRYWDIQTVSERRAINSKGSSRGPVSELLISRNCVVAHAEAA